MVPEPIASCTDSQADRIRRIAHQRRSLRSIRPEVTALSFFRRGGGGAERKRLVSNQTQRQSVTWPSHAAHAPQARSCVANSRALQLRSPGLVAYFIRRSGQLRVAHPLLTKQRFDHAVTATYSRQLIRNINATHLRDTLQRQSGLCSHRYRRVAPNNIGEYVDTTRVHQRPLVRQSPPPVPNR